MDTWGPQAPIRQRSAKVDQTDTCSLWAHRASHPGFPHQVWAIRRPPGPLWDPKGQSSPNGQSSSNGQSSPKWTKSPPSGQPDTTCAWDVASWVSAPSLCQLGAHVHQIDNLTCWLPLGAECLRCKHPMLPPAAGCTMAIPGNVKWMCSGYPCPLTQFCVPCQEIPIHFLSRKSHCVILVTFCDHSPVF